MKEIEAHFFCEISNYSSYIKISKGERELILEKNYCSFEERKICVRNLEDCEGLNDDSEGVGGRWDAGCGRKTGAGLCYVLW